MSSGGTFSYDRRGRPDDHRYYATDRRRQPHNNNSSTSGRHSSSFSIMKWFRRANDKRDDDSTWFRDDLQRIRQAYAAQESECAAVTPIAARRRRRHAGTWSKWSGSTTTVYSFAYVDGGTRRDDDAVEYIDATATLPEVRRHSHRAQCSSSLSSSRTGTMTATRRRNKKVAPPPPPQPVTGDKVVVGPSPVAAETSKTTAAQRRTATAGRKKKYRAPQPPAKTVTAVESLSQQQQKNKNVTVGRRVVPQRRRNKGPAPKPPAAVEQQLQRTNNAAEPESNVKRKISQYERQRLMERVDKIEKHFFEKHTKTTTAAAAEKRASEKKTEQTAAAATNSRHGFASASALYTAMAVTNLTELDKRAAEICRRKRLEETTAATDVTITTGTALPRRQQPVVAVTGDHKNAIVAAIIRRQSYPSGNKRPAVIWPPPPPVPVPAAAVTGGPQFSGVVGCESSTTDDDEKTAMDEKQLVRHKRLAFFQQRATTACADDRRQTAVADAVKSSASGTAVAVANTSPSTSTADGGATVVVIDAAVVVVGTAVDRSSESKNCPSEDNNCYEQLMAMEMQSDLVLHNGHFECAVCLCTYDNNGIVLRDCLHVFCRPCLQMTIGHSNAERVVCPYIDERYSCPGVLQHREIKKILDTDEEYERFLERSVERARQLLAKDRNGGSFQCARPDCTGWCLIYDKQNVFEFKCPVCQAVTCVRCRSIHASSKGCRILNNENGSGTPDTLENLIERGDAMPCPGCDTILSKQQGCDWIKCAVCFMEICWATKGPRWGPKGKGDTTAGCMCGIPVGRKCHVDCKYCH